MKGGVIPSYDNDPYIFNTYNVVYNSGYGDYLINFVGPNAETLELTSEFTYKQKILTADLIANWEKEGCSVNDVIQLENDPAIGGLKIPGMEHLDLDLNHLQLYEIDLEEVMSPGSLLTWMNMLLEELIMNNKSFSKFIKSNKSPFSIVRDTTDYNELRPQFNLFNKYTFINKFYEFLDILIHANTDAEIKTKLLQIFGSEQSFVNGCDYMTMLETIAVFNDKSIQGIQIDDSSSLFQNEYKDKAYAHFLGRNGFTRNLQDKLDTYMAKEIKAIKEIKKEFLNVIENASGTIYKDISDDLGMNLLTFTILFYIYERFNTPQLEIANREVVFFPISKQNFINNLLQKTVSISYDKTNIFNQYPKKSDYSGIYHDIPYSACAERGLFEYVKFISFNPETQQFTPPETMNPELKELFHQYSTLQKMKNDNAVFSLFIERISNLNGILYKRISKTGEKFELKSIQFDKLIQYIFQGNEPQNPFVTIELIDNQISMNNETAKIKLVITKHEGHIVANYFTNSIILPKINLINNLSLHYLIINGYEHLNELDTSKVTNMAWLFDNMDNFNQDISSWNTSNVVTMSGMFNGCKNFNQDISSWNTSNVKNMRLMFYGCTNFNQDISSWNVSNVIQFSNMFRYNTDFNLGKKEGEVVKWHWDLCQTRNIEMNDMFNNCRKFNQDISSWNTSHCTRMYYIFGGCTHFNRDFIQTWIIPPKSQDYLFVRFNRDDLYPDEDENGNILDDEEIPTNGGGTIKRRIRRLGSAHSPFPIRAGKTKKLAKKTKKRKTKKRKTNRKRVFK